MLLNILQLAGEFFTGKKVSSPKYQYVEAGRLPGGLAPGGTFGPCSEPLSTHTTAGDLPTPAGGHGFDPWVGNWD